MNRREFMQRAALAGVGLALSPWGWSAEETGAPPPPPRNVVFILADDLGWGDLGCYGAAKVKTPNLDRLAEQGMRFIDVHACGPLCSATRYGLLSGEYNFRNPARPIVLLPEDPLVLRRDRPTLASVMKAAGYATGIVGKWHLGFGDTPGGQDWNGELKPGPLEVGFDSFYGYAVTNGHTPCVFIENHRVVGLDPGDPLRVSNNPKAPGLSNVVRGIARSTSQTGGKAATWKDEEIADVLTGKAVEFIERHRDRPFFLYFAMCNIHNPLLPNPRFRGASQAGVRGDTIQEMDASAGEVLRALDRLGLAQDTLVIFTSDNGGTDYGSDVNNYPINGPWHGVKGTQYEGGHREPFIVRWPGRVKPGQVSEETFSLVDMVATFAALTGQPLPRDAAADSFNVLPALLAAKPARPVRDHLVVGLRGSSIRVGPWKLIDGNGVGKVKEMAQDWALDVARKKKKGAVEGIKAAELYNLKEDPGETRDLAEAYPEKVKELWDLLERIRTSGRSRS